MTMNTVDRLVEDYLRQLDGAARDLPSDRRADLLDEIGQHIEAARNAGAHDEAGVRDVLDRLGSPGDIAAAARGESPPPPAVGVAEGSTRLELAAVLLLTLGSVLLPVLGWLIGVVLLWASASWTTREKLLGTLVVPGGLGPVLILGLSPGRSCSTSSTVDAQGRVTVLSDTCSGQFPPLALGVLAGLVLLVAPLAVAVLLLKRARARAAGAARPDLSWHGLSTSRKIATAVAAVLVALSLALPVAVWTLRDSSGDASVTGVAPAPTPSPVRPS